MATAQASLFDTLPAPAAPLQRWWRLQGQARRDGRRVEPLLVTPRFVARIDAAVCPVTRMPMSGSARVVVALRPDASVAAGHLATLGRRAAAVPSGTWGDAWAQAQRLAAKAEPAAQPDLRDGDVGGDVAALDAPAWRRLAVLRSFVQALTPAEAATLPLHVLPPARLRVLSPVQGLQVAMTLALLHTDRTTRLMQLVDAADGEDLRLALRLFALTLLARRPADLHAQPPAARRHTLEDLWDDPLLQRRWSRLALRLTDEAAQGLLRRVLTGRGAKEGWRTLDLSQAIDGWDAPARMAPVRRPSRTVTSGGPEWRHEPAAPLAAPRLAPAVLAAVRGGHGADAVAAAAGVA